MNRKKGSSLRGHDTEAKIAPPIPEPAAPFQVRAVDAAPAQAGEGPGQEFQVRDAATVTLPPPHWAKYQATPPDRQEE